MSIDAPPLERELVPTRAADIAETQAGAFSASFAELSPRDRYKLLCGAIVPRPIALVTTSDADGRVNAAPFSFFNVFGEDPALVILGLQHRPEGSTKDTNRNIRERSGFVVNLVDEALADAMNICAIDFPPDESEIEAAGLALLPSVAVAPPRIAQAPVALECRRHALLTFGPDRDILIGEVIHMHARAGLLNATTLHMDAHAYRPIGRLAGNLYARQGEVFALERQSYEEWRQRQPNGVEPREPV